MPDRPPPRNQVPLYIQQTVSNGVTIDWGDGTAPETLPRTGQVNTTHTYEQAGDYVISLEPAEGCELGFGRNSSDYCLMGQVVFTSIAKPGAYSNMLNKAIIGKNVDSISAYTFNRCFGIKSIVLPNGVKNIGNSSIYYCQSLTSITIPDSVLSLGSGAFSMCSSLASLTIPDSVTSIGNSAFSYCYGIKEYHFLSSTPPTLGGTNVSEDISSDCIIYVPVGSAEAYKTATNWTTYSQYIQEEPA